MADTKQVSVAVASDDAEEQIRCCVGLGAGNTEAKKMYVAGAKMCKPTDMPTFQSST